MNLTYIPYVIVEVVVIAVLFLIPSREVTQPPGKWQFLWEILVPGTSPAWTYFGGLVLAAWSYLVIQDIAVAHSTPYVITAISTPNLHTGFGVPATATTLPEFFHMINPSWVWLYLAPAVLFAVNLFLVLRGRRA